VRRAPNTSPINYEQGFGGHVDSARLARLENCDHARQGRRGSLDRLVPLRRPDLEAFSNDELKVVDQVIKWLWGKTAKEVSELSHEEMGWKVVEEGEDIPYSAALLARDAPLTEQIRRHAA